MVDSAINPRPRIASVGDNCIDVYVGDHDARFPGGNALNVAALSAAAGLRAAYLGTLGDDANGDALLAAARTAGVDVSGVLRGDGPTGVTTVRLVNGEREFLSEEYGISLSFVADRALVDRLRGFDWVHMSRLSDGAGAAAELARTGTPVSRDFGTELRHREPGTPIEAGGLALAFFSAADRLAAEAAATEVVDAGAAVAVGTIGAEGAIVVARDGVHHQPALASEPVDTLGAGDAFIAGFIGARLQGAALEPAMRSAAEAAAETCARLGAWGALDSTEVSQ